MAEPVIVFCVQSLRTIALSKSVIDMWNEEDVRKLLIERLGLIPGISVHERENKEHIENLNLPIEKIKEKVQALNVPKTVKQDLLRLVAPIGRELFEWVRFHGVDCYTDICLPSEFSWTSYGTINNEETAKKLTRNSKLNIVMRYYLACTYCIVDDITVLYEQMSENDKTYLELENIPSKLLIFVRYWTYKMRSIYAPYFVFATKVTRLRDEENLNRRGFQKSVNICNKPAAEFYFERLPEAQKNDLVIRLANQTFNAAFNVPHAFHFQSSRIEMLLFLILKMKLADQVNLLNVHGVNILRCFLQWPFCDFFLNVLPQIWSYLSENDYVDLLISISDTQDKCLTDYYYPDLFVKVWRKGTPQYKKYVVNEQLNLLAKFFIYFDFEDMRAIFKDATVMQKKNLACSSEGLHACANLFKHGQWNKLNFLLNECISDEIENRAL